MYNTHEDTHLIDTQEQIIEDYGVEQEELFEDKNENTITGKQLENINSEFNHNFTSPPMNSGIITVHHNDPENSIGNPEYF